MLSKIPVHDPHSSGCAILRDRCKSVVVDRPGWDWPNCAGDPRFLHVGQQAQQDQTVFYLKNQLLKDRPVVLRWHEKERSHLQHEHVYIVQFYYNT